ncbi:MAG TPA: type II toxin-antitoxin system VapC family toxin [Thermoanaerobaculia bacterium]|nr:type II toxin-antitoxin system VapC family toxin [Thermoanaerobaculia bacterium]
MERGVVIVLDTHAWIWWAAEPERLSARARHAIDAAETLGVSAISCWEVAMLVARGRLDLDRDVLVWIRQALAVPRVKLLPLTPEICVASALLAQKSPADPADRMIAASALEHHASIVTKDSRLRSMPRIETVW